MKDGLETNHADEGVDNRPMPKAGEVPTKGKRRRGWRWVGFVLLVLVALLGIGRAIMPWAVRNYVNRTLDRSPLYAGNIGEGQIHLWRGAYSIQEGRISKTTGNVPVPFFSSMRADFAMQ